MALLSGKSPAGQGKDRQAGAADGSLIDPPVQDPGVKAVLLAQTVEREIIPRLVRAHAANSSHAKLRTDAGQVTDEDVALLTQQVIGQSDQAMHETVAALRDRGVSVQSIFLELLAPVARRLGEYWTCDQCDFTQVTVAMGRLQQLLRANSSSFGTSNTFDTWQPQRRVLLLPCPGEQHTFGLSLVAEFFYRAGWDVSTSFNQPSATVAALVERQWFDAVGLSVGVQGHLSALEHCLTQIRNHSMNPQVCIIVGGSVFSLNPAAAEQVKADAVVTDASTAPELAGRLVDQCSAHLSPASIRLEQARPNEKARFNVTVEPGPG